MSLEFCITREQLEKAVEDLRHVAGNGFPASLAVFRMASVDRCLDECQAEFEGVILSVDGTPEKSFGRGSDYKDIVFENGRAEPRRLPG